MKNLLDLKRGSAFLFFCVLSINMIVTLSIAQAQFVERPPQYIAISFDGSSSIPMWERTLAISRQFPVKFTYFISGVYYVDPNDKMNYIEPSKGPGKSAIGWSSGKEDITRRLRQMDQAMNAGNEMGSHVNGHFPGNRSWNFNQWNSEFTQFKNFIENVFTLNRIDSPLAAAWPARMNDEIKGFRGPQLEVNGSTDEVMKNFGFTYDASRVGQGSNWPRKNAKGFWEFSLASLTIAGTAKRTLSMDYNFYYAHSQAQDNSAQAALFEEQTYQTYMNYFNQNYAGNRAPMNIGHHFSNWNGGAYNKALYRFIAEVCGKPEVKCARYKDLVNYMNSLNSSRIMAYQNGEFPKTVAQVVPDEAYLALEAEPAFQIKNNAVFVHLTGKDARSILKPGSTVKWFINDQEIADSQNENYLILDELKEGISKVAVKFYDQNQIETLTHTQMTNNAKKSFALTGEPLEKRNLQGDMPEAHLDQ